MQFCIHLSQLYLISYYPQCIYAFFVARHGKFGSGRHVNPKPCAFELLGLKHMDAQGSFYLASYEHHTF